MTKHREFPNFEQVSSVDVDAGCIWVGDPCYVLKDSDESRPKDLGKDWHDICRRFFSRSGYDEAQREWSRWNNDLDRAMFDSDGWKALMEKWKDEPPRSPASAPEFDAFIRTFREEYQAKNPFVPSDKDKGFANFTHDLGHGGMGTMVNTFYGDGSYPVYIEYGEGGRPRRVLIDFDPGYDEEGDEEGGE